LQHSQISLDDSPSVSRIHEAPPAQAEANVAGQAEYEDVDNLRKKSGAGGMRRALVEYSSVRSDDIPNQLLGLNRTETYERLPLDDFDGDGETHFQVEQIGMATYLRRRGREVLGSHFFQSAVGCVIIANAAIMGFETDHPNNRRWELIETIMLMIFTGELLLRVVVFGWSFWDIENHDFTWNIFDAFVVVIGLLDSCFDALNDFQAKAEFESVAESGHSTSVATVFRIFRLLRILRIFRIFRFLKQLYILSYGFGLAAVAVFWVTLLMAVALYVCSIVLVRTVGHIEGEEMADGEEFWSQKYGTVPATMFTLFQLMMQPNMREYQHHLQGKPIFTLFIVGFIIFGAFGMIALLTGVISESMFQKNQMKIQEERHEREIVRKGLLEKCQALFDEVAQHEDSDEVSSETIRRLLPRLHKMFESFNLPYTMRDLQDIVNVMDTDGSGSVNRSEFCRGLLHIAENGEDLRPMLMMELHYDTMSFLKGELCDLKESMSGVVQQQGEMRSVLVALKASVAQVLQQQSDQRVAIGQLKDRFGGDHPPSERGGGGTGSQVRSAATSPAGVSDGHTVSLTLDGSSSQVQDDVRVLQGQLFALAGRMEELLGDARNGEMASQLQELAVRRQCMESDSVMSSRLTALEGEVGKLRSLMGDFVAQRR